jgi:hypothetical protein
MAYLIMTSRYLILAVFFLLLQVLLCVVLLSEPGTRDVIVWYCNSVPLFLGLAFLFGQIQVVKGLTDVGIVAQLLWVLDFFAHVVFHVSFFHITDYVFTSGLSPQNITTVIVHLSTPFVALGWSYRIAPRRISLVYSCAYIIALYFVTIVLTPAADNVNYIFRGFDFQGLLQPLDLFLISPVYILLWPVGMMFLARIGYGLQTLLYKVRVTP